MADRYMTTKEACELANVAYGTLKAAAAKRRYLSGLNGKPARIQRGAGRTCAWYWHPVFVENVRCQYAPGSLLPT